MAIIYGFSTLLIFCHTIPHKEKSTIRVLFLYGGYGGSSPLVFFKTILPTFCQCLEKAFGHRLKPFPESFLDGWGSTLAFCHTIPHKEKSTIRVLFLYGGYGGSRTRVRKPLGINFSVGS